MDYNVILILILLAYIAFGVLIDSIVIAMGYDDNPSGIIVSLWPLVAVMVVFILIVVIIPSSLGEMIGDFIKRKTKN